MLRIIALLLVTVISLSSEVATAKAAGADDDSCVGDNVVLQLKWKHQFQFAGYYAAQKKGFYKEQGLCVEIRAWDESKKEDIVDMVVKGDAHFGIGSSGLVIRRFGRNASGEQPIVALFSLLQRSPLVLIAADKPGIKKVSDLRGRKIMLEDQSEELTVYLLSQGLSMDAVEKVPHQQQVGPLVTGAVDAMSGYLTEEPHILDATPFKYKIFHPSDAIGSHYSDILFTSRERLAENQSMVRRFVYASLMGWRHALTNTNEMIELIIQKYRPDADLELLKREAEGIASHAISPDAELGEMQHARWVSIVKSYMILGNMPESVVIEDFVVPFLHRKYSGFWMGAVFFGISMVGVTALTLGFSGLLVVVRVKTMSVCLGIWRVIKERIRHVFTT